MPTLPPVVYCAERAGRSLVVLPKARLLYLEDERQHVYHVFRSHPLQLLAAFTTAPDVWLEVRPYEDRQLLRVCLHHDASGYNEGHMIFACDREVIMARIVRIQRWASARLWMWRMRRLPHRMRNLGAFLALGRLHPNALELIAKAYIADHEAAPPRAREPLKRVAC